MTEVRTYPAGVTSWIDIEQHDIDAAQAFYRDLFGWTFVDAPPPGSSTRYVIAQLDGHDAAGIGSPAGAGTERPDWKTYISVDDADVTADRVSSAGGSVLVPPASVGEAGISAVCTDPLGVEFRLWQPRGRPGAQIANVPGAWNFSDLRTTDAPATTAFYAEVFGWVFDDIGYATMIRRPGYGDHLAATVDPGIHERQDGILAPPGFADATGWLTPAQPGESPHWHVTFTVADRDDTVETARHLGAEILTQEDTDWTRDALIRDPQGATFTASQFTPPAAD